MTQITDPMGQFKQKDFKCLLGEAGSSTFSPPEPTELTLIRRDRRRTPQPEEITHRTRVCCTNSTTPFTSDSTAVRMWVLWQIAACAVPSLVFFCRCIQTTKTGDAIDRMVMIQGQYEAETGTPPLYRHLPFVREKKLFLLRHDNGKESTERKQANKATK